MARRKLPADTGIPLVPWQRWGVCEAGTAAIGAVALTTGYRCQRVAAQRAGPPHQQSVQPLAVQGVPGDEAQTTRRPTQVAWVPTAWAMGRWCLLGVACGPRPQDTAAALLTPVIARPRALPRLLTDGWQASTAARLQVVGGVEGSRRVVFGGPRRCGQPWRLRQRGTTLQTACMARWDGTVRGRVAPLRRRPRGLSWSHTHHRGKVWRVVSLYTLVMPPKSLRPGRTPRPPAMARGRTDHIWSYGE
jgi:hypothetical protein